jgi:hypothetical protein
MTELMLLLVFMSIAFTFLSKDEARKDIPQVQKELEEAKRLLVQRDSTIRSLRQEVASLKAENRRLNEYIAQLTGPETLTPQADFPPKSYGIEQLRVIAREQRMIIAALQRQVQEMTKRLNGGKAPGLPICTLTRGFLLAFTLKPDGNISGVPGWSQEVGFILANSGGLPELSSGRNLSLEQFSSAADKVKSFGMAQSQPCTFRVSYRRETTDAAVFEQQLRALGGYFYVAQVR